MVASEPVVGIDLGTTNSCVAVVVDGSVHVIPDEEQHTLQASLVACLSDGRFVVGNAARPYLHSDPQNTVFSAKRLIGQSLRSDAIRNVLAHFPYEVEEGENLEPYIKIRGERYAIPEISAMVLRRMADIASAYLQTTVTRAVITVPANFNDTQRQMTKLAGELAGLQVMRVINEPTAAALAYGYGQGLSANLAVYDFGGGTFDATILKVENQVFQVLATAGDCNLGGDDFDQRLSRYMMLAFQAEHGRDLGGDPVALTRLREVAESTKLELSDKDRALVHIEDLIQNDAGDDLGLHFRLDRKSFEERCGDIVQRTFLICDDALSGCRLTAERIDQVLLVGGTTRMPLVRSAVGNYFGRPPLFDHNPDEVVAIGAALQADALTRDPFREELEHPTPLLIDVTPRSLGVGTVGGFCETVIQRNTPVPFEQKRIFSTTADGQTSVLIEIYQGEERMAVENVSLGELVLYDLPKASRGRVEIEVTFEMDTDGILMVSALNRDTGHQQGTRISVSAGYSEPTVARMFTRRPDS